MPVTPGPPGPVLVQRSGAGDTERSKSGRTGILVAVTRDRDADAHMTRLVESWCRWYHLQDPADRWAEQEVIDDITLGQRSVEDGWSLTLRLLEEAPSDIVLGIIGASPIEDLLGRDPVLVTGFIEAAAPGNERLRRALSHTWKMPSVPDDLYMRVKGHAQKDLDV
jgi:hypothetical protein